MDPPFDERKLDLPYPCSWSYTVIGEDEFHMRQAIDQVAGDADYEVSYSRASSKGRYCSLHLEMMVRDEEHRLETYHALNRHEDIRFVL